MIAAIRKEVEEENLPKFKYVELNGMRMTRPKQAYAAIWSQLTGEKRTADHASELLEEKFESRRMKEPILMLVDELGKLSNRNLKRIHSKISLSSNKSLERSTYDKETRCTLSNT